MFGALYLIRDNMDYGSMGVALIVSLWLARGSRLSQAGVIAPVVRGGIHGRRAAHHLHFFVAAPLSVAPVLLYRGGRARAQARLLRDLPLYIWRSSAP